MGGEGNRVLLPPQRRGVGRLALPPLRLLQLQHPLHVRHLRAVTRDKHD